MNRIDERLDQQIDALIAGEMPDERVVDSELRGLLETAQEVRQLGEPEWPGDDFPATLAAQVISRVKAGERKSMPFRDDDDKAPFAPNGLHKHLPRPISTVDQVIEQPDKRPWLRHGLEIVAAGLVLAVVAALMITLLGNRQDDDEEPTFGGPVATTQPGWTTMRSDEYGFAVDYPAEWNADPEARFAAAPDQTVSLTVSLFQPDEPIESNEQLESWVTQDATEGEVTVLTSRDLGGVPNAVFQIDTTELYSNPIVSLSLYAKPNEWVYEVHCASQTRDDFARWRSTCEQIIESFRFIDSEPTEPADASGIWNADPIAKRLHDEGLGRDLGLAQTVDGYTMTLNWVGADYNRIGLHLTLSAPDGQLVEGMNPLKPRLTAADGTNLRSIGGSSSEIHDGVGEYLEWFDASAITTAGEIAVQLEVPAIQVLIPVDPDGTPPPDVTVVPSSSAEGSPAWSGTHDAQGLPLSIYRTGDSYASVTVHGPYSFNFSLPFEPDFTGQSTPTNTHSQPIVVSDSYTSLGQAHTDGRTVVWITEDAILGSRIASPEPFTIADNLTHSSEVDIDGDIVVWDEADSSCGGGCPSVYGKNLSNGETFIIAKGEGDVHNAYPSISGSWVVWLHTDTGTNRDAIMARNVITMAEPVTLVERAAGELERPVIDGEHVVWVAGDDDAVQRPLMLATLSTAEVRTLAENGTPLRYDIGGNIVVYVDSGWHLNAINLATGEITAIHGPVVPGAFGPGEPATDGHYVIWSEMRDGDDHPSLWSHNLEAGQTIALAENGINTHPEIANGIVVWTYQPGVDAEDVIQMVRFPTNASGNGAVAPEPTPPATNDEPLTLDQAKERVRDFLGEPEVELDGYLSDPREAVPGRGIEPGPGLVSAPTTFVITRQVNNLSYADEFAVDPETGEVIGANMPSNTTLGQLAQPVSEAAAQAIAEAFARRHFYGFAELTFREVHTRSSAPGLDDGDPLFTALWQRQAVDSIAWLPIRVRVSVDLETGQVFNYSALRAEYDGPTTPEITDAQAVEIALAEARKDPELAGATIGTIALETAAPDGQHRLVWFILLDNVPDGANPRHFQVDALTGDLLNPIGSPNG